MKFGEAIEAIRDGRKRATRKGWHGKGMFIFVENPRFIPNKVLSEPQKSWFPHGMKCLPHLSLFVDMCVVRGWLASQTDMLAEDWILL